MNEKCTKCNHPLQHGEIQSCIDFGKQIRIARLTAGLSQLQLSKLTGHISAAYIALLESNKRNVKAQDLWGIAQITQHPIEFFFSNGIARK